MPSQQTSIYKFGPFSLYPAQRLLIRSGQEVDLSPKELDVLLLFLQNASKVLSKEQILSEVWKDIHIAEEQLYQTVAILRKKLGNYHIFIQIVRGRRYRFIGDVEELTAKVNYTNDPLPRLHVFLCHANEDKPAVRDLYRRLSADGIAPWLDEEVLLPGEQWQEAIAKAIRLSDVVIACLSCRSVNKVGYFQKEIKLALDFAQEQPEGTISIIPLRLEKCAIPEQLRRYHGADYFEDNGYERLLRSLRHRARTLGIGD